MRKLICFLALIILGTSVYAQFYRFSEGLYRLPYQDGTSFVVTNDIWTHNPLGKYDMIASPDNRLIVAAADGWVRAIQESFDTTCWSMAFCCWMQNNYVIIEHPNGEWSQYTHIQVNSATNQGVSLGQWVTAGTPLGVEGNVGCSTEPHLHFELSRPSDPANAFAPVGGFLNGELLIPVFCGVGTQPWLIENGTYTAGPCNDDCPYATNVSANVGNGGEYVARADNFVLTSEANMPTFLSGSATQFRAANYILLRDGFEVKSGAKFQTVLKGCNVQ